MESLALKVQPIRLVSGVLGVASFIAAYAMQPKSGLTVLLMLLGAWLITPFVLHFLVLENRRKYFFWITVYPRFLRTFVAYGWLFGVGVFTFMVSMALVLP